MKRFTFLLLMLLSSIHANQYQVIDVEVNRQVFKDNVEAFKINFKTTKLSTASLLIYDSDLNLAFRQTKQNQKDYKFIWNFKATSGRAVNHGLYFFRIEHESADGEWNTYNRTLNSGVVDVQAYWPKFNTTKKEVSCRLKEDALVCLEADVNGLKQVISDWEVMKAGLPSWSWSPNQKVEANKIKFNLKAIKLPENTIVFGSDLGTQKNKKWIQHAYNFQYMANQKRLKVVNENLEVKKIQSDFIKLNNKKIDPRQYKTKERQFDLQFLFQNLDLKAEAGETYSCFEYIDDKYLRQIKIDKLSYQSKVDLSHLLRGKHLYQLLLVKGTQIIDRQEILFWLE